MIVITSKHPALEHLTGTIMAGEWRLWYSLTDGAEGYYWGKGDRKSKLYATRKLALQAMERGGVQ
jgi:hypothetical protein